MKKIWDNIYAKWGLTAFLVIIASICFFFSIFKIGGLMSALGTFINILKPFIYGGVMAYLLLPIFNPICRVLKAKLLPRAKNKKRAGSIAKMISSIVSVLILIAIIVALLSMVLPQLVVSVISLANSMDDYLDELSALLGNLRFSSSVLTENLLQVYERFADWVTNWLENDMLPQMIQLMGGGLLGTVTMLKNIVIGIIIAIYILSSKDLFSAQAKKLTYSILSTEHTNIFLKNIRFVHQVFGGFITGKLIDSLIIGVITCVILGILKMPYVMLISVVIGVTNIIPFFGPFIGAIPCALLILVVSPLQFVYFVIFVIILQQFDGNILGPKILGNSTGLSSFWVMFAILIAGGLFGFVGMVLGVPIFAVLYSLICSLVNRSLENRAMPTEISAYYALDHLDPETGEPVHFTGEREKQSSVSLNDKKKKRNRS